MVAFFLANRQPSRVLPLKLRYIPLVNLTYRAGLHRGPFDLFKRGESVQNMQTQIMESLFIPTEEDFKRWIGEALSDYFQRHPLVTGPSQHEDFLNRKQVAELFQISLVTLHEWIKNGLPSHKQGGRVYFLRSEVFEYVRTAKVKYAGSVRIAKVS